MGWEIFKAMIFVIVGGAALMAVAYRTLCWIFDRPEPNSDICTTHHSGDCVVTESLATRSWGYYFHDPYGAMISIGGFRSERSAYRAAQRHRTAVAKELQEACGL